MVDKDIEEGGLTWDEAVSLTVNRRVEELDCPGCLSRDALRSKI